MSSEITRHVLDPSAEETRQAWEEQIRQRAYAGGPGPTPGEDWEEEQRLADELGKREEEPRRRAEEYARREAAEEEARRERARRVAEKLAAIEEAKAAAERAKQQLAARIEVFCSRLDPRVHDAAEELARLCAFERRAPHQIPRSLLGKDQAAVVGVLVSTGTLRWESGELIGTGEWQSALRAVSGR